jgi:hypothetical protein
MNEIVRCVIHPGVGIARLGNSPGAYFIGPEAPGELPHPEGGFKDSAGRIKRQAARFRVYGLDKAGAVVREITADAGKVTWRVHLANRKAAWYQFLNAMDLGSKYAKTAARRNSTITGSARRQLIIDPGPRSITGRSAKGSTYRFDSGTFMGTKVPLGELRTDDQGRLLVLGGFVPRQAGDNVRQQRRVARRHLRRMGQGDRPDRGQGSRGGAGGRRGHSTELWARAVRRRHHVRRRLRPLLS